MDRSRPPSLTPSISLPRAKTFRSHPSYFFHAMARRASRRSNSPNEALTSPRRRLAPCSGRTLYAPSPPESLLLSAAPWRGAPLNSHPGECNDMQEVALRGETGGWGRVEEEWEGKSRGWILPCDVGWQEALWSESRSRGWEEGCSCVGWGAR